VKYSADDKQSRERPAPPAVNHFAILPADVVSDSSKWTLAARAAQQSGLMRYVQKQHRSGKA
jgi:hypothetical protein